MHCVYKAGGWQPKAAGGWFALLTLYTITNTTIVIIVVIYNKGEVTYSISSIIYITSINNLIINKWYINRGG